MAVCTALLDKGAAIEATDEVLERVGSRCMVLFVVRMFGCVLWCKSVCWA